MHSRTESAQALQIRLLEVVGDPDRAAFVYRLLRGEATAEALRTPAKTVPKGNPYLRRKVEQPSGSKILTRFRDIGLADRGSAARTYQLNFPEKTRALLKAANDLAEAIGASTSEADQALAKGLRLSRLSTAEDLAAED